jgi:hypothetical protein
MDNWGDPWADNAKSPTKDAVTSPLPPTFAPAPSLLNGFLDDAGWGNEEESFGDWSIAPAEENDYAPSTHTSIVSPFTTKPVKHPSHDTPWPTTSETYRHTRHDQVDWAEVTLAVPKDEEQVFSETSDSSTTVQTNDITEYDSIDVPERLRAEDGTSARTSTSPSEASHNDVPTESPRTSYEEERGGVKDTRALEEQAQVRAASLSVERAESISSENTGQEASTDVPATSNVTDNAESVHGTTGGPLEDKDSSEFISETPSEPLRSSDPADPATLGAFALDSGLLEQLFTPQKETKELAAPPDDPIYSTEARKSWYRLTRKQTMREFNHGDDDDNYIRVTWTNSQIRSEVNNIVGRWAREDRISGKGPGARASFYWDSPAPVDFPMHTRQRSSVTATSMTAPVQESLPPLSTNAPAAFNWSTAAPSVDPWQQASPGLRSASSPLAPPPPIPSSVTHVHKQEVRAASLDLTSYEPGSAKHARNLTVAHETPIVANLISPPISNTPAPSSGPWTGLDILDAPTTPKDNSSIAPVDNDDEWGEMVSTPTVSTPTLTRPTSQADTRNNTVSTTTTTPQSTKTITVRDYSPDAMSATTIVRLKSTISPTSAHFKAKSFVPLGMEQGPIGPGILKSAKRSVSITTKKVEERPALEVEPEVVPSLPIDVGPKIQSSDDFSEWQTSVPGVLETEQLKSPTPPSPAVQDAVRPITPPQPEPVSGGSKIDAWADADFSFFESAPPVVPLAQLSSDASDPFSVFEGRQRSVSVASSAKTFTRSPPRKVPTPPIQPLTGATSSAQRRKAEEDAIVRDILGGLPDLSYMLR